MNTTKKTKSKRAVCANDTDGDGDCHLCAGKGGCPSRGKKKLPAGLPPLPPVPEGFDAWEYMGKGWRSEACVYACFEPSWMEWFVWGSGRERPAGCKDHHYIRAIRREKPTVKESLTVAKKPAGKGRVVAVRMWTCGKNCTPKKADAKYFGGFAKVSPVFVLPADAASVERMVEQAAQSVADWCQGSACVPSRESTDLARAALAAIGIRAPGKGGAQ